MWPFASQTCTPLETGIIVAPTLEETRERGGFNISAVSNWTTTLSSLAQDARKQSALQ
jgi:hypothetical protein